MLDVQIDAGPHFLIYLIMKYLFIDESNDNNVFVVGGILIENEEELFLVYNQFKKQINRIPLTRRQKEKICFEFKSTLLENSYPQIKRKLLYKLNALNCDIVYDYRKMVTGFNQETKRKFYLDCLTNIVNNINDEMIIVTIDELGSERFENLVFSEISKIKNVKSIIKNNSFNNKGLQIADNIVGVIRKHLSNIDKDNFYSIIANKIKK